MVTDLKVTTRRGYGLVLDGELLPRFKDKPIVEVDGEAASKLDLELTKEKLAKSTRNNAQIVLRSVLRFAVERKDLGAMPSGLPRLKQPEPSILEIPTDDQVAEILRLACPTQRRAFGLMAYGGPPAERGARSSSAGHEAPPGRRRTRGRVPQHPGGALVRGDAHAEDGQAGGPHRSPARRAPRRGRGRAEGRPRGPHRRTASPGASTGSTRRSSGSGTVPASPAGPCTRSGTTPSRRGSGRASRSTSSRRWPGTGTSRRPSTTSTSSRPTWRTLPGASTTGVTGVTASGGHGDGSDSAV